MLPPGKAKIRLLPASSASHFLIQVLKLLLVGASSRPLLKQSLAVSYSSSLKLAMLHQDTPSTHGQCQHHKGRFINA
jgi:hypothetical protein